MRWRSTGQRGETMSRAEPIERSAFEIFRPLQSRWGDNDIYGHMNNVIHYALFDTAINGWLVERGLLDLHEGSPIGLVVETGCHYFAELAFPDFPVDMVIRHDNHSGV